MPSLILEDVPPLLFDQIQRLASARKRTPAETALEVLESAFQAEAPDHASVPPPGALFVTDEVPAPFDIPRPNGVRVEAKWISAYVPEPHDVPDAE